MKNFLFVLFTCVYIIFVLGLVLHTSAHPQVLGKYTIKYLISLIFLILLFWPYVKFLKFSFKTSTFKIRKTNIVLSHFIKFEIYLLIFIFLILLPTELYLRYKHIEFGASPIPLVQDDFHPFLQHQNAKIDNKIDTDTRYTNDLHINSNGFRGEEIQKKKPAGVYRIFILGGSTVLNRPVPFEENSARVLEKMLNSYYTDKKFEVMNAGAEDYTTEHSIIQYMFKIKDFQPDLIIMYHGINDMTASCTPNYNSYGEYKSDYSNKYSTLYNMVINYFKPKPIVILLSYDFVRHFLVSSLYSDILNPFRTYNGNLPDPSDKPAPMDFPSIESYKRNLQDMINVTKADGVKLILGDQPSLFNKKLNLALQWQVQRICVKNNAYPNIDSITNGLNNFNNAAKTIAEENNIPFVDIASMLPKNLNYFWDIVHFKANSNKIVAQAFFDSIVSNKMFEK